MKNENYTTNIGATSSSAATSIRGKSKKNDNKKSKRAKKREVDHNNEAAQYEYGLEQEQIYEQQQQQEYYMEEYEDEYGESSSIRRVESEQQQHNNEREEKRRKKKKKKSSNTDDQKKRKKKKNTSLETYENEEEYINHEEREIELYGDPIHNTRNDNSRSRTNSNVVYTEPEESDLPLSITAKKILLQQQKHRQDEDQEEQLGEITIEEITANTVVDGKQMFYSEQGLNNTKSGLLLFRLRKAFNQLSRWSKAFLAVTIIMFVVIAVSATGNIILLGMTNVDELFYSHYFLNALNITQCLLLTYSVIEALITENEYQLITFMLSTLIMTARIIYALIETSIFIFETKQSAGIIAGEVITNLIPACVAIVCQIILVILMIPIFRSFGWKLYRIVGTSPHLIRHYRAYEIYVSMVKMDLLCLLTILAMCLFFIKFDWWPSYIGFALGFIVSLIAAPISVLVGCQREFISIQLLYIMFCLVLPSYLMYKIIDIWVRGHATGLSVPSFVREHERVTIRILITVFGAICILWRVMLIIMAIVVTINFRKGLAEVFAQRRLKNQLKFKKDISSISVQNLIPTKSSSETQELNEL